VSTGLYTCVRCIKFYGRSWSFLRCVCCIACVAMYATQVVPLRAVSALRICCVKISRNARNARNELALNYAQGPWLRCLRCVRCVMMETGLKRRITHIMPHNSPGNLVFCCQKSLRNSIGITPHGSDKSRWGGLKFVTFDEKRAITRKRYKTDV